MNTENKFIIDNMEWSFTRLKTYLECPYEFYSHYILCQHDEDSFYGEYGSFMHKILELYEKGELSIFELNQYYEDNFNDAIMHDAPPNNYTDIRQSLYDKGIDYLNEIDIDDYLEKSEILGVEKKVHFEIAGKPFVGIIDLLLRDKETGEITVLDHKTGTIKILKNGDISKKDLHKFNDFKRQLGLYALQVREEYGHVDWLVWNMVKQQDWIKIPWTQDIEDEAVSWATDAIRWIEDDALWQPNPSFFYCNHLCGQRYNACEYKA